MNLLNGLRHIWLSSLLAIAAALGTGAALAETFRLIAESPPMFSRPHDILPSADERFLYVADLGNDVVRVLDARTLTPVGELGRGELSAPHDVAFDREGRLLVADSGNNRILRFQLVGPTGMKIETLQGGLVSPEGVAALPDGRVVATSTGSDTLVIFERSGASRAVGGSGAAPGQFRRPHDIAVDGRGMVYVVDSGNHRIQVLNSQLFPIQAHGGVGYDLNEPKYLDIDEQGRLYVADEYNNRIVRIGADRRAEAIIGSGAFFARPPIELNKPEGVAVRGRHVWVADTYNNRILLFAIE